MAYDASNTGNQPQQVASSTPLSQGGGQAAPAQPTDSGASAPSQPATIQAGANTAQQAAGQAQTSQNKAQGGKASSGMFTNIQKYSQANQPQATKMAKAAGSVLEKQATNVGEQVAKQQQSQQTQVDVYNARMEAAKNFANQQIQAANTGGQLSETDIGRFRNLATGNEGFGNIQSMNLAQQQAEAARLQQQAGRAASDEGRRELLKQRFAQGGQQYTQGQQGLDALIVGSNQDARQALNQTTKGAAQQAQGGIESALQQQAANIQGTQQAAQDFRTGLQEQTTGATQGIITDLDAQVAAEKAAREKQLEELTGIQSGMKERISGLQSMLDMSNKENRAKLMRDLQFSNTPEFTYHFNPRDGNRRLRNPRYDAVQRFIETGDRNALLDVKHRMGGQHLDRYLRNSVLGQLGSMGQDLSLLGIDPNLYAGSFDSGYNQLRQSGEFGDLITGNKGRKWLDAVRVFDEIANLQNKIGSFDADKLAARELEGTGLNLEQLRSGEDIRRESIVSDKDMARYQALSKLAGTQGQDLIKENVRDRLDQEEMKAILDKLRNR